MCDHAALSPVKARKYQTKQNPSAVLTLKGFGKLKLGSQLMPHIIHDISVALWARRVNHYDQKDVRLAVTWPLSVRLVPHTSSWFVNFRVPKLHVLNSYDVELAYRREHSPDKAPF